MKRGNKLGVILYTILGIILIAGMLLTNTYGLGQIDKEAYSLLLKESTALSDLGFEGYNPGSYKIRFYDGKNDYVVEAEDKITKEKNVYDSLVATAWLVGDEYQVLVPVYDNLSKLTNTFLTAGQLSNSTVNDTFGFSKELYVATISHEAFHVWQFNQFESMMKKDFENIDLDRETIITSQIDNNDKYVISIKEEADLLFKAYNENEISKKTDLIQKALEKEAVRRDSMTKEAGITEYFIENLEGSAQYIEALVYRDLAGDQLYSDYYLQDFNYSNGSSKYYTLGLMKCLILDQLDDEWQNNFSYDHGLSELLKEIITQ